MFHVPNDYRITNGELGSNSSYGNNGAFALAFKRPPRSVVIGMLVIASDGEGWEHASVSINRKRCPYWDEMCFVKNLFWDEDDAVIQIHPPKNEYVSHHPYALHLWRKVGTNDFYEKPPWWMVGPMRN